MCESALNFLQKRRSSGFVRPPFHNVHLKKNSGDLKKKKKRLLQPKPAAFCVLRVVNKKVVIAHCVSNKKKRWN